MDLITELELRHKIEKLENTLIELTGHEENYLCGCDITRALKKNGIISD